MWYDSSGDFMRMRRKPWANDMIASRQDCVINNPSEIKGNWKQFQKKKIVVEIGAGKGDYWIAMAHQNPDELWVAIEKDYSCSGIALKKSLDCTSENMKFIVGDAAKINEWFDEKEVDRIHLNFSDPWPKKSHTKRRLTYSTFLQSYQKILKRDGCIVMKTDNAKLFEFSLVSFSQADWPLVEVSVDFRREEHPEDAITEYENNFMDLGQPIYRAVWKVPNKEQND